MMRQAPSLGKFKKLLRRLRPHIEHTTIDPETIIVGLLEKLWHATLTSAPAGDIGRIDDELLCETIGWRGEPSVLLNELVECRWLDRHPVHRFLTHDWHEHCPDSHKRNMKRWGKTFIYPVSHNDRPPESPPDDPPESPLDDPPETPTEPYRTKPNQGRLTSDEGDQIEISIDEEVRSAANRVANVLGLSNGKNDRSLVIKVAWLSINRFGDAWLINGLEAVKHAKKKPHNNYAYFHRVLEESCSKKLKKNFARELALLTVPDELLDRPPPRTGDVDLSERMCAVLPED